MIISGLYDFFWVITVNKHYILTKMYVYVLTCFSSDEYTEALKVKTCSL